MNNPLDLIKNYLEQHVDNPPESFTLDSKIDDIGLDSMALLELFFELEDRYGIRLPEDVPTPQTVGQLVALIEQYRPETVSTSQV